MNYEKNRSLNNPYGEIDEKLKEEIGNLTIEKIIGNVTLQSLEYYLYENFPKNEYQITEKKEGYEIEEYGGKKNLIMFLNIIIW